MNAWVWGIALLLIALALLAWKKRDKIGALFRKAPAGAPVIAGSDATPSALGQIVSASMATHARATEATLVSHIRQWGTAIRMDIAKASSTQSLAAAASDTASASSPADGTQTASPVVPAAQALTESAAPSAVRPAPIAAQAASTEKAKVMNEGTGSIAVATMWHNGLPTPDMLFLLQVMQAFPGNGNLPEKVLAGTQEQILEVKQYLHNTGQEPLLDLTIHDHMTGFKGPLRDAVKPVVKATIDGRTNPWSRAIYQRYFDKYLA